jgi:probable rRNA maturation factor
MAEHLDVAVEDPRWDAAGLERLAETAVSAVFAQLGMARAGYEISILGCDDDEIAELNAEFRGKAAPTNVLSWPAFELAPGQPGEAPLPAPEAGAGPFDTGLGDIAISYDTCAREASEQTLSMDDHAVHLLVHATLHLLGYDHENDADAARMEALEVKTLETLNIANPY